MNITKKGKKVNVWNKEQLTAFLEIFEGFPCLYDPKNKFYSNKHARADALNKLKEELEPTTDVTVEDIKTKINNIRTQISHELKKMRENHSGMETEGIYEPVWWFDLAQYLIPFVKPRKSVDNLGTVGESEKKTQNTREETPEFLVDTVTNEETQLDLVTPTTASERATSSSERSATPNGRSAKRQKTVTPDETYIKTVETLQVLNENIIKATAADKLEKKETEFANFIAKELGEISDPEILLDAKHEISNIIYNYKRKWLKKHAEITFEVINSSDNLFPVD